MPARATEQSDAASALPAPPQTSRGEVPFSEPVAPVPGGLARWTLAFSTLIGVADPFYDKVMFWGSIRRGSGSWAIEAFGGRAFSWSGPALDLCVRQGSCNTPAASKLGETPGNIDYLGGLAGVWRAAEGKLSVGGLSPVRFSLEASFGPSIVRYHVYDTSDQSLFGPGARAGLGFTTDINSSFAVRCDLQGLFYRSEIRGVPAVERELLLGASIAWNPGSTP